MRRHLLLALPVLLGAPALRSQAPLPPSPLAYRGFALAAPYAEFSTHARSLTDSSAASLICNTSRRTAQLMECGVPILDPTDSADFYLAAYVLEGQVAFLSFGDSGSAPLVERLQRDLEGRFGKPHAARRGMWEWRSGGEVARLTWRARGSARWVYVALWDEPLMNRIASYVPARRR
jgi:hypothetical protein